MENDEKQDQVERYSMNRLNEEERQEMEKAMKEDAELQEEANFLEDLREAISMTNALEEAEATLEADGFFNTDTPPTTAKIRPMRWLRPLSIAASLLLLIFAAYNWLIIPQTDWKALSSVQLEEIEFVPGVRQEGASSDSSLFGRAILALADGAFSEAEGLLVAVPEQDAGYARAQLLLAYSALQQGQYKQAQEYANTSRATAQRTGLQQKAEWLQVKAGLGLEQVDMILLNKMADTPGHRYQPKAKELLHILE